MVYIYTETIYQEMNTYILVFRIEFKVHCLPLIKLTFLGNHSFLVSTFGHGFL